MAEFISTFCNFRKPRREGKIVSVGRVEDVPPGRGATVELEGGAEVAVFNTGDGFYAIENFCPHRGAPLAEGQLAGKTVTCEWHGWRFDLASGQCLTSFGEDVECYPVIVEDGCIRIVV